MRGAVGWCAVIGLVLLLAGGPALAGVSIGKDRAPAFRVQGGNRVETAVALSEFAYEAADHVVIVPADIPELALPAAPLAVARDGVVLLSYPDGLAGVVGDEITRLGARSATVIGDEDSLSVKVVQDLEALGLSTSRIDGGDAFTTAVEVAEELPDRRRRQVFLAPATPGAAEPVWQEALIAAPLAATAEVPLLLTLPDRLPPPTADYLRRSRPEQVVVIGAAAAVSGDVTRQVNRMRIPTVREVGADIHATAVEAARDHGPPMPRTVLLTSSSTFPDGLAAGPAAAELQASVLLVHGINPAAAEATMAALDADPPEQLVLIGGPGAIRGSVEFAALEALDGYRTATKTPPAPRTSLLGDLPVLLAIVAIVLARVMLRRRRAVGVDAATGRATAAPR